LNWANHPGHDLFTGIPDIGIGPSSTILYSDPSGIIAIANTDATIVADLSNGVVRNGPPSDGVLIPKTGWYRSRSEKIFLPDRANGATGVSLTPITVGAGELEPGRYTIWALTFVRLETGFYFIWYAVASVTTTGESGLTVRLSEAPGARIVRLYVQRAKATESLKPLAFLGELTGDAITFEYSNHAQEGEYVNLAFPRAKGTWAAYYNGRYFYQADQLTVIGESGNNAPSNNAPTSDAGYIDLTNGGTFGITSQGVAFTNIALNAPPIGIWAYKPHDVTIETNVGTFAAIRHEGLTYVYNAKDNNRLGWSLVYQNTVENEYTCGAHSPSRVVLAGKGGKILVGRTSNNDHYSLDAWSTPTLPVSTDINDVIWTGNEFVALTNRGILRGGPTGATWTLVQAPPALYTTFVEWRHLVFFNNRFYVYAAEPGSGQWRARIFVYDGATWSVRDPYVLIGPARTLISDLRFRSFSHMFIHNNALVVAHQIVGDRYGVHFLRDLDFIVGYHPTSMEVLRMAARHSPEVTNFGKGQALYIGYAVMFRNSNFYRILWDNPNGSMESFAFICFDETAGSVITEPQTGHLRIFAARMASMSGRICLATRRVDWDPVARPTLTGQLADGSGVYSYSNSLYIVRPNLTTRLYSVARNNIVGSVIENDRIAFVIRSGATAVSYLGTTPENALVVGQVNDYSDRAPTYVRYLGGKTYVAYPRFINYALMVDSEPPIAIPADVVGLSWDGSNLFVVTTNTVYRLTGTNLVPVATGNYTGTGDAGAGFIYLGLPNSNVDYFNTATSAATTVGTLPAGVLRAAWLMGSTPVVLASNQTVYFHTTTFQTVASFVQGSLVTTGQATRDDSIVNNIPLEQNTVVWTEPNHINLTNPFYYHTFVPRMSRTINDIIPHPAGVMVLMDNETYIMSGRFTSVNDTRVALYPQTIGLDKDARLGLVGPNVFTVWNGKIFQIGDGDMRLISNNVDDGVPFTAALFDHPNSMLVAMKSDGRVLRYDLTRQVWFNDMDDCLNIAQTVEGIAYLRTHSQGHSLYKLADTASAPTSLYYRIPQTLWIDAVALNNESLKRLRALRFSLKTVGPANPFLRIYNESEVEVISQAMLPTHSSNAFGLGRYQARFTPVVGFSPVRINIAFDGFSFELPPFIEVDYEARERKA